MGLKGIIRMAARILVQMPGKQLLGRRPGDSGVMGRHRPTKSGQGQSRFGDPSGNVVEKKEKLRGQQG